MDLVADKLCEAISRGHAEEARAERIRPSMRRLFSRLPLIGNRRSAFTADRLINRFWHYPRHLRSRIEHFDLYHVSDHSYAHLVHDLPAHRTGVACHDLDAFRVLWASAPRAQAGPQRLMARHILNGMRKAAVVFCDSRTVLREIQTRDLLDPERLVYAPHGVSSEFSPNPGADERLPPSLSGLGGAPFILHVGSCIQRKRIDILLEIFSGVRRRHPGFHLVQVGGRFNDAQKAQILRLGLEGRIHQLQLPTRSEAALSSIYRRAELVLLPSESEGFGFVVIEALACGRPIIVSDHPVLREVGAEAALYCSIASVPRWLEAVERVIANPSYAPSLSARLAQARRFTWESQARTILDAYARLCPI